MPKARMIDSTRMIDMELQLTELEKEQIRTVVFDLILAHEPETPITEEMMCRHPNWPVNPLDEIFTVDSSPVWDKMAVEYAKDFDHNEWTPTQRVMVDTHEMVREVSWLNSLPERITALEAATEREQRLIALLEEKDKQINNLTSLIVQMGEQVLQLIGRQ